jgi:histidinol-phosphate phosphatase family protein
MSGGTAPRGALFLDRDGTLIVDAHYLRDPARVTLLPGAIALLRAANDAGIPVVVVTNQSGIARGLITPAQYEGVRDHIDALVRDAGARIDATYHCPHWPDVTGPCDCRKPGLGMYRQAAAALDLDLARSAYVGDRWRDVEPALRTGGLGVLVPGTETPADDVERTRDVGPPHAHLVDHLDAVLPLVLAHVAPTPPVGR